MKTDKKTILFLCTGNSCRSQMAEGWTRHLRGNEFTPFSAGIEKHGLNPDAMHIMKESGVDMSSHQSNLLEELPLQQFDYVITLCGHAHENCPYFPGKTYHVGFDDPPSIAKELSSEEEKLNVYRRVSEEIKDFVLGLPENLNG